MDYRKTWWLRKDGQVIETFDRLPDALKRGAELSERLPESKFKVVRSWL